MAGAGLMGLSGGTRYSGDGVLKGKQPPQTFQMLQLKANPSQPTLVPHLSPVRVASLPCLSRRDFLQG